MFLHRQGLVPPGESIKAPFSQKQGADRGDRRPFPFAGADAAGHFRCDRNLRTSGLLGRFLLGVDQLSWLINSFVPNAAFPELRAPGADRCDQIVKQYYSYQVLDADVSVLQRAGVWSRP